MKAFRSHIFHFINRDHFEYFEDGLLILENGLVKDVGYYQDLVSSLDEQVKIVDKRNKILMPGFIDGHVHAVQTRVMASFGTNLLEWLEKYTFPEEAKFSDSDYANQEVEFFFNQLLKNGTTCAAIYSSVHQQSFEAIAETANHLNMRVLAGKTHMDRNAPENLCEKTDFTYESSRSLINKYDSKGRFNYILTPRFAITSTPRQLEQLMQLKQEFPLIKVQTHISENIEEIESTMKLFPDRKNYLDVYDYYELVGPYTLLGHSIHFNDEEWETVKAKKASLVHCPSSNQFLGSGLFDLQRAWENEIPVALGSDIGGGFSFSMLKTAAIAYQVGVLRGYKPPIEQLFYLLTLGGAIALGLDDKIGNFEKGKEADFILMDPSKSEVLLKRIERTKDIKEILFAILFLGDDRVIDEVYLMGNHVAQLS
jgi:guanine deaminase